MHQELEMHNPTLNILAHATLFLFSKFNLLYLVVILSFYKHLAKSSVTAFEEMDSDIKIYQFQTLENTLKRGVKFILQFELKAYRHHTLHIKDRAALV